MVLQYSAILACCLALTDHETHSPAPHSDSQSAAPAGISPPRTDRSADPLREGRVGFRADRLTVKLDVFNPRSALSPVSGGYSTSFSLESRCLWLMKSISWSKEMNGFLLEPLEQKCTNLLNSYRL
ncbi:hypothetical protein EYF80_027361 [Liparis tanakae]|uniref:Uncharacterized protein n=1 Tax=Liparis tanakae TaxID=230148 RepID=A0A4Z2HBS0_9TELE|nr:hypothetical protein EYF80_027361 [Liparis tanakae]